MRVSFFFGLFWPVWANFGYFVANLCTFGAPFVGLNIALVYQNRQISGMATHTKMIDYKQKTEISRNAFMPVIVAPKQEPDLS